MQTKYIYTYVYINIYIYIHINIYIYIYTYIYTPYGVCCPGNFALRWAESFLPFLRTASWQRLDRWPQPPLPRVFTVESVEAAPPPPSSKNIRLVE